MTQNGNLKRRVRARAAKTGESYTAALRHVRRPPDRPGPSALRLAVAQTAFANDPGNGVALQASAAALRRLMVEASKSGARLIHFPEGAICVPNKRIMSETGPADIGPADWSRFDWSVLRDELDAISQLAKQLRLWTVLGSVHRLTPPHRPHNSLYVISDRGELATRYDERMLSHTKLSFMYSPGSTPITFTVDCVLFSTTGEQPAAAATFAAEVLGHAASNSFWVSYCAHATHSVSAPSGIAAPDGRWAAQCAPDGALSLVVTDITINRDDPARPWRRRARAELYSTYRVAGDPRSADKSIY